MAQAFGLRSFRLRSLVLARPRGTQSEECAWELGIGLCSARLQAGISWIPKCPPEDGRYI